MASTDMAATPASEKCQTVASTEDVVVTPRKSTLPQLFRIFFARAVIATCAWLWILHHSPLSSRHTLARHAFPAGLRAGCDALLEPTNTTYLSRLERLSSALSAPPFGTITYVLEPGPSAFYYLGAFSHADWGLSERPFLIAITPTPSSPVPEITLLTPAFESLRARLVELPDQVRPHVVWAEWVESDDPYGVLLQRLDDTGALVLDPQVRSFVAVGLRGYIGPVDGLAAVEEGRSIHALDADTEHTVRTNIALIRERKDVREVGLMRCANQMTLHAIRQTRRKMRFGISESQTRALFEREAKTAGLTDPEALVLFGENAALPHGSGTDRKLGKSDLALIDAMGIWGGYTSDITRTFALPGSKIPQEHVEIWDTVRRAQVGPSLLLTGSNASSAPQLADLDAEARRIVSSSLRLGVAPDVDYSVFTHRLGHGIGLEVHESPYVVQGPLGDRPVVPGYVFSQEPGIYIPLRDGKAATGVGVRLEDCFVVTERDGVLGGEWLTGPVQGWGDV
ncbi:hypothetical protein Q5752_003039 [Cryptotrichosporon argae]